MTAAPIILVVDDTGSDRFVLDGHVREWGYVTLTAENGRQALDLLRRHTVDLVISDQEMDDVDGLDLLRQAKRIDPGLRFVLLTAYGRADKAVAALKAGADDYLAKPYQPGELRATIARLLDYGWDALNDADNDAGTTPRTAAFGRMVTASPKMRQIFRYAGRLARDPASASVLIEGESGTGKELLARAMHAAAGGTDANFAAVNCAAIPPDLLESELFGHVRGAFTGAVRDRDGKFDLARGGSLLLDEINDMPLALQVKLLRVLQERRYERLGDPRPRALESRVICAANQDLRRLVEIGQFREDLFYRIHRCPITIPPLRQRKEDIPLLVNHFIARFSAQRNAYVPGVSTEALERLFAYHWPGNVRELENCLETAVTRVEHGLIRPAHLSLPYDQPIQTGAESFAPTGFQFDATAVRFHFETDQECFSLDALLNAALTGALDACGGNVSQAARLLGIDRKMFYRRGLNERP